MGNSTTRNQEPPPYEESLGPPSQGYPPAKNAPYPASAGYPPPAGAYPPPAGGAYPPAGGGAYPPPAGAYPPPAGAYPPPAGAYPPPAGAYPPPAGAYPPPAGAYPPAAVAYPPGAYPPGAYPPGAYPPGGAYPPAGGGGGYADDVVSVTIQDNDNEDLIRRENIGPSCDPSIRRTFIRKVYLILCLQFAVTTATILIMKYSLGKHRFKDDVFSGLRTTMWVCFGVFLATWLVLACCKSVRRKHPHNILFLAIFTLALSGFSGCACVFYSVDAILMAMGSTCIITIGLTLFACQTKFDFTGRGAYIFSVCLCVFCFALFLVIFGTSTRARVLHTVYGSIIVLIYSIHLVYHTQLLLGGRKYVLSEEEYVFAALTIYIHVVAMFLRLLHLGRIAR